MSIPSDASAASSIDQRGQTVGTQYNYVFAGAYERLRDAYISPQAVWDRVDLAHFTGREWLVREIDAFLATHDRGYWVLEAGAGLGKTTFLAWLVQQQGYLHHFSEQRPGQEGVAPALRSLAAQLAERYGLGPEGVLPANAASYPDYLYGLLAEAAAGRSPGSKIILVVDALDEAGTPLHQNVLGLPRTLPEGVYFLVSQRPLPVTLAVDTPRTPLVYTRLAAESAENRDDMRRFLAAAAGWPGICKTLASSGYSAQQFTDTLLDKCKGVWIYLHYVVHEIDRNERSPLALETLPEGMASYYAEFWQRWRTRKENGVDVDVPEWWTVYQPFLAMLAASREPCTVDRLAEWAGIEGKTDHLWHLCNTQWRPFLAIEGQRKQARYRFYHATLQEFFEGKLKSEGATALIDLAGELAEATQAAHSKLCDRYLGAWGGLEANLPELREAARRDIDEGYGLRHVAAHMESAVRVDELHHLLRIEWLNAAATTVSDAAAEELRRNAWFATCEAIGQIEGYRADVTRAWRMTEATALVRSSRVASGQQAVLAIPVGLQCRYALLLVSLNSLAVNIPPELLVALVQHTVWSPQLGMAYAQHRPYASRADALIALAPHLAAEQLDEALRSVRLIEDGKYRSRGLAGLAPHLSTGQLDTALHSALVIEENYDREQALIGLAPFLSATQLDKVLSAALTIEDNARRVQVLAELAQYLAEDAQQKGVDEAWRLAQSAEKNYVQAGALARLAPYLSADQLGKALCAALAIENSLDRWVALDGVMPYLSELQQDEALRAAQAAEIGNKQVQVLQALAPYLSAIQLDEALRIALAINNSNDRAWALGELAPYLAGPQLDKVLSSALDIENSRDRSIALNRLAPHLTGAARAQAVDRALCLAQGIQDGKAQANALAELAPHLSASQLDEALRLAQAIDDVFYRSHALASMTPHLSEGQLERVLCTALSDKLWLYRDDLLIAVVQRLAKTQPHEALRRALTIKNADVCARALVELVTFVARSQPGEALRIVQTIEDEWIRLKALLKLAPHLSASHLIDALRTTQRIDDCNDRAMALVEMAPYLSGQQFDQMLRTVQTLNDSYDRSRAMADLATQLAELQPAEALHIAVDIDDTGERARALAAVTLHFAKTQPAEALRIAQSIEDDGERTRALAGLAPYLSEAQLTEALSTMQKILNSEAGVVTIADIFPRNTEYLGYHSPTIAALAIGLAKSRPGDALQIVKTMIRYPYDLARALAGMTQHLPSNMQAEALCEALLLLQDNQDGYTRVRDLADLASDLPNNVQKEALADALQTAYAIEYSDDRAQALAYLAPQLESAAQREAVREALRSTLAVENPSTQVRLLGTLAPYLSETQLEKALYVVQGIEVWSERMKALAEIVPHVAKTQPDAALNMAKAIEESNDRARMLIGMAPYLSAAQLREALRMAQAIDYTSYRGEVLAALAPHLAKLPLDQLYPLWSATLPILATRTRSHLLSDLAALQPVILRLGGEAAIQETAQAILDVGRWWP